jgi:hypothetical protein
MEGLWIDGIVVKYLKSWVAWYEMDSSGAIAIKMKFSSHEC